MLTLTQAVQRYGIPRKTLADYVRSGKWGAMFIGSNGKGNWLFDENSQEFQSWHASYRPGRGRRKRVLDQSENPHEKALTNHHA